MHRFFVSDSAVQGGKIILTGDNAHHLRTVLRIRPGEEISVCTEDGTEYTCRVLSLHEEVEAEITDLSRPASELSSEIILFQCLPKKDKMELIIQKAVELGVSAVVPVVSERVIVKYDEKKTSARSARWNAISESAAKQSKRSVIPKIGSPVSFSEACHRAAKCDIKLMPYENAEDMNHTRTVMESIRPGQSVAVLIGPEGGFSPEETDHCREAGFEIITLGRRILRTETAAISMLSVLMYYLEE